MGFLIVVLILLSAYTIYLKASMSLRKEEVVVLLSRVAAAESAVDLWEHESGEAIARFIKHHLKHNESIKNITLEQYLEGIVLDEMENN